jgi:hypothetical protein
MAAALDAARGAITLLRNDPYTHARGPYTHAQQQQQPPVKAEAVLPLPKVKGLKIGLIGPVAHLIQVLYHCTVLLHCTVLFCTVLYCTVLYCTALLHCTALYCTVLYFTPNAHFPNPAWG